MRAVLRYAALATLTLAPGCYRALPQRIAADHCAATGARVLVYVHGVDDVDDALCDPQIASVIYQRFRYAPHDVGYSYDEARLRAYYIQRSYSFAVDFDDYLQRKERPYTAQNLRDLRELGVRRTPAYILLDCRGEEVARYTGPSADEDPEGFATQFRRFLTLYGGQ